EAGVLAHGPEAAAIHRRINAAGVGEFAGIANGVFGICARESFFGVEAVDREAGERGEVLLALFGLCVGCFRRGHGLTIHGQDAHSKIGWRSATTQRSPPRNAASTRA